MIVASAKQLFEQRTFTRIPEILKLPSTKFNTSLFGSMSLGYMALTSAESSLENLPKFENFNCDFCANLNNFMVQAKKN